MRRRTLQSIVALILTSALIGAPQCIFAALQPAQIRVIINDRDPLGVAIGKYYAQRRNIAAGNVIHIIFRSEKPILDDAAFEEIYQQVRTQTNQAIQAYALTWASPYRVNCMSITSAFAFGFAKRHCAKGCKATEPNPYFDSDSATPFDDYDMRPTMAMAARTFENAAFLIDREIQADFTKPRASAYLVVTGDKARSSRAPNYFDARRLLAKHMPIKIVHTEGVRDVFDIMSYFTGIRSVPFLDSLGFLPGALADHLTSAGGKMPDSSQMSAMKWLESGATGSFGTVIEPCNFPQKFPNAIIAMRHYLSGDSLIEAYWKSVAWPGQRIFIGEPLAKPYASRSVGEQRQNSGNQLDDR